MHILINSVYHISAYYGGNEHYLHHLALGLQDAGHSITYIAGQAKYLDQYPYTIIQAPVIHLMGKPLPTLEWQQTITSLKPDILHASGSGIPLLPTAFWLKHSQRIPTVLTYQAPTNPSNPILKIAANLENAAIPRAFSAIIATGPQNYQLLQDQWPYANIEFIPMMLAPHFLGKVTAQSTARKQLSLPAKRPTILFVGQLDTHHYYKAFPDIIKAAQLVPDDYLFLVLGDGNLRDQFQNQINQIGLSNKFHFVGFIPNDQVTPYFHASDCFILPSNSDSEGFGLVLLEAMASKLPTITTTAIGSASWLKEHNVSNLIPPSQPKRLAKEIINQIDSPDKTAITRAQKFARSFTRERMVNTTFKLYQRLIKQA